MTIEELQAENERLKGELKKWEDRSKVVKDGCDGEVYEWEDNYYIVTPYLNVFVKGLLKEKEELKGELQQSATNCNKLRYDRLLFRFLLWKYIDKGFLHLHHRDKGWVSFVSQCDRIERRCKEAYRKAKAKLRSSNG